MAVIAAGTYLARTRAPRVEMTESLGAVHVYPAWLTTRGFAYVFSGAHDWGPEESRTAEALARGGDLVAGIDTPQLIGFLNQSGANCVYLPGNLEGYSRVRERAANTAQYLEPILLGHDIGATLVYMAQLQAPALAFDAAVAIDPEAGVGLTLPFCDHTAADRTSAGQTLKPESPGANVPLRIELDAQASARSRQFAAAIPGAGPTLETAAPGHLAAYRDALDSIAAERLRSGVADLPLVDVPAMQPRADAFAILYSGDGGWRDLDRTLADVLAAKGLSVVGVDVLRYYWKEKSPAVAARDLDRIIRHYQQSWQRQGVVLIGFSFGADVLPFMVNRLPADVLADVRLVTLLSPERTTAFEVEPTGWFGVQSSTGAPIGPELLKLAKLRVQCIYGSDEADGSLCTSPAAAHALVLAKSGGHHFDEDYGELAQQILSALAH